MNIGQTYSFTTAAPAVLGATLTGRLIGQLDYETASDLQPDLYSTHSAVRRYLTDQTKDATQLTYYRIVLDGGERRVIAAEWLTGVPIPQSTRTAVFTLPAVDAETVQLVRDALTASGVTFTVIY